MKIIFKILFFLFCITAFKASAQAPANDNPCNAIPLTPLAACNYAQYTNANATATAGVPAPGCGNYLGGDVWFSAVVPLSGSIIFDSNTGVITDGAMALYTGTCGALSLVACDDDGSANGLMPSISQAALIPGSTVYIRFWDNGNAVNGTFSICAQIGVPCNNSTNTNSSCATANPFCTGTSVDFCNTTGVPSLGGGGIYGCLGSAPNPAFYFLNVATSGPIVFNISQQTNAGVGIDVDYIIWGPFASQAAMCAGVSAGNIVSCSYSTAAVETATIPSAVAGQWYLVLITNYSGQPGVINFSQTNTGSAGAGSTNCNILNVIPGACAGGFYNISGSVICPAPPATGTLTITNSCGGSVVLNAPFSTNISYSIPTLLCGSGNNCNVSAVFSAAGAPIILPTNYTAPSCNTLTAVAGLCSGGTYVLSGTLTVGCLPATGTLTITSSCGGSIVVNAPFTSPYNWSLPASSGNGGSCTVTAVYSAPGAPIITPFVFNEPTCCPANAGTITVTHTNGTQTVLANGTTQVVLCPGGSYSLVSNNDYVLPPAYDPGFDDAELFYAIYTQGGPTTSDPTIDPTWTGYYWTGQDFTTANSGGLNINSSGSCSPFLTLPGIPATNNTLVFVPITADDGDNGLDWDGVVNHDQNGDGCYDLGNPISVTWLNPVTFNPLLDCSGTASVQITGGEPQFFPVNYTLTNTGAGTLTSTSVTSGGNATITGLTAGQTYSFNVNDGNGCISTFSGIYSGPPTVSIVPSNSTVCTGGCVVLTSNITTGVGNGNLTFSSNQCAQIPDAGIGVTNGAPNVIGGNWAHTCISVSGVCDQTWETGNPLTVSLNILHTYDDDLNIYLQAPNGTYYLLSQDIGGAGDNFTNTIFTATAGAVIPGPAINAPYTNSYKPQGAGNNFSGLNNTIINGTWCLWVADDLPGFTGTLLNWSITFGNQNTFLYTWSPTTGLSSSTSFTPTACPVASTTYTLTVTNTCGCTAAATAIVNVGPPPVINVNPLTICSGQSGILTATGATTYTWSPSTGLSASTGASVNANPTVTTTYTVTGTVAVGCSGTATSVVTVNPTPSVTSALPSYSVCSGSSPSIALTPIPVGAILNWTGSDGSSGSGNLINNILNNTVCPSVVITYTVTPVLNGCPGTPINIPVTVYPKPTSTFTVSPNPVCANQPVTVTYTGTACPGSTYNWTWPPGATILSGAGAGPYQVQWNAGNTSIKLQVVSPTGACTSTQTIVNVTVNTPPTIVVPSTAICIGQNGTLTATGALNYTWSPNSGISATTGSTVTVNPVTATTYTINGTDANGCTNTTTAIVTVNPQPTIVVPPVSICNGATGILNAAGATTYTWSPTTGLSATTGASVSVNPTITTTYTIVGTNAGGCTNQTTAIVTVNSSPTLSTIISNPLCFGGFGSITLNLAGGTAPFTFQWSNGFTTQNITGLTQGTYTVTVTSTGGCTAMVSATLIQPLDISNAFVTTAITCAGTATGSINLTPSGGVSPYTYLWTNGETTEDLFNQPAGTYWVTVTDVNLCTKISAVILTDPPPVIINVLPLSICAGHSGTLTATGASTYAWSPSTGLSASTGSLVTANPILTTTYTVIGTAVNGCTNSATAIVTVNQPPSVSLTLTPVTCNGGADGAVTLSIISGSLPLTFIWNNGSTTQNISNLGVGLYSVTVTSATGCTFYQSITVWQPSVFSATTSSTNASCGNSNGTAGVSVFGGTPGYNYLWSNGNTLANIGGLSAGNYSVTVTDAHGCTASNAISISNSGGPTLTITPVAVSCNGGNNGSVSITVSNGTPLFIYLWSNGATTQNIPGLIAGNYSVTVTDANNCIATASTNLIQPLPVAIILSPVDATCNGGATGSISSAVSGGTSPYAYLWSNGAVTPFLSNLAAGNYSLTVTDINGCTGTASATVNQPLAVSIILSPVNVLCNSGTNGSISTTVSGGATPYTFLWSNGANTPVINSLAVGTYSLTVTDFNGCTSLASATLTQPTPLIISETQTDVLCFGGSTGAINLIAAGGTSPYNFLWSNAAIIQNLSGLNVGNYAVTVTDANGCTATSTYTISENPLNIITLQSIDPSCGLTNGSASINTISGGGAPYSYLWNTGGTDNNIANLSAGVYSVTITNTYGCTSTATINLNNSSAPLIQLTETDVTCFGGSNGSINLTVNSGVTPYTFSWSNGFSTQNIINLIAGNYVVTVLDASNCVVIGNIIVNQANQILPLNNTAAICQGQTYNLPWGGTATTAGTYSNTYTTLAGCDSVVNIALTVNSVFTTNNTAAICQGQTYNLPWGGTATTAGTYSNTYTTLSGCDSVVNIALTVNSVFTTNNTAAICQGQTYNLPWGGTATTAGTYSNTYTTLAGCDSVVNIALTVNSVFTTNNTAAICQGQTYNLPWGGTATTAGTYSNTYTTLSGCDSVVNIALTVNSVFTTNNTAAICQGQTYNLPWGGTATTAGTYSNTYTTLAGCDSVVNIALTVNSVFTTNNTAAICQGQTYNLPWGGTATTAGTYSNTYTTLAGCDSVVNIALTVNSVFTTNNTAAICQGQTYNLPWGGTATTAGTYSNTYTTLAGCDSVVNIALTVNSVFTTNNTAAICQGQTYNLPWGGTATTAGTYSNTYTTLAGCDSVVNIALTVNSVFTTNNTAAICQGQTYNLPWGGTATTAGTYSNTYTTLAGCDSVVNIALTVNSVFTTNNTAAICQGQTYNLPWGGTATTAGTYSNTYTTLAGCDSVVNIALTVNSVFTTNNTAAICQGQTYNLPWGGTATTAGTYSNTYTTLAGCDSVVNIALTVNSVFTTNNTAAICQGQTYNLPWGGTATTAGTYSNTYTTLAGCDSVVNIALTVNSVFTTNNTAAICQGQTYNLPWGGTATTAGTYSNTYTTLAGCDSVVNIALTVNSVFTTNNTAAICQGQTYNLPWGGTATTAGTYSNTYTTLAGCDSVVNIALTVNSVFTTNNTAAICQGQTYNLPWGGTATTAGTYSNTYTTLAGCDSVVNIALTVNSVFTTNNTAAICQGQTYNLPWGGTATTAGTYSNTYTTLAGCDSVVNIALTVNSVFTTNNTAAICQGQTYNLPWGGTATTAGTYSNTYTTLAGCDSVVNIALTVNSVFTTNNTAAICQGQTYNLPWGGTATTAGTYSNTYTTLAGCDSVVNIALTVNSVFTTNNTAAICQGQTYNLPWGGTATTAGTYSNTYTTLAGCDSVVNIALTVNSVFTTNNTAAICQGQTYNLPWGGTATTAGTYSNTYTTLAGCDSVVNIALTVNSVFTTNNTAAICQGQTYNLPWGGTATTAGTYSNTYTTLAGCDSVVNIALTVNSVFTTNNTAAICQGQTYNLPWGGTATTAGTYSNTYTTLAGCDSVVNIALTVNSVFTTNNTAAICQGQTYNLPWGGTATTAGTYSNTYTTLAGCDSVVNIALTVNSVNITSETLTSCNPADTGVVSTTYTNQFGCDSVHTVTTTFLLSDSTFQTLTSCNPADTGIVSTTYTNQFGCDSVHTVTTTFLLSDSTFQTLTSCNPADTGVVATTYTNQFGCDSVHTVTTTFLLSDSTFQTLTSCNPADTGIVSTTYTNQFGCDSVHTVTTTFLLSDSTFQTLTSCNPADTGIVSTTYTNQFGCDSVHTVTTTFLLSDSTFQILTSCNPADTGVVATTYTNQFGCDSVHTVTTTFLLSDSTFQTLTSCNPADTGVVSTTYTNQFGCDSVHTVTTTFLLSDSTFQTLTSCNPADTGVVSTTYTNQFGCDSVHTVTTTFLLSDSTFQTLTSCNPADTGIVSTTYTNQFGCDSVHTVTTTFLLSDSTFQTLTSCNPADTGIVSTTYTNQFGCDSVHTVTTTFLLSDSTFQTLTSCNPADTGIVSTTYTNQFGCDSVHTVTTTFLLSDSTFQTLTSCNPADTGVVSTTYTNQFGCDSVHTVTTTFLLSDSTFQTLTSCNPADTGIVSTTYTNQFGCDSVHTVTTTFLLSDSTFQILTSCNPADTGIVSTSYTNQFGCDSVHTVTTTFLLSDSTFQILTSCNPADTGVVATTYTNQFGCDSVHTVTTTFLLSDSTFQTLTSCNPADTGIVSTTYTNQFGCDSVHTVTTTFLLSDSTFQTLTSCNPADTGVVSTTYTNQFGCDSVHTVTTTFLLSDSTFQTLTSCNPADTGVVSTTYTNQFGCDSVHTVTTTFLLSDSTFQILTSCNPADTGVVATTYTNQFGCDSVHTVTTTFLLSDSTFQTLTSCNPADTGIVSTTYTNQFGCDSVHTVTTTFLLSDSTFQILTSCNPADTGVVATTYTNQFGCDSVHTVTTTFLLSDSTFQTLTSCNPADTGVVSTTYTNQFGCDSVHTVTTTFLLSDSTFQTLTSCNPADTGVVATTYTNQFGCDSVHTVTTTFLLSDSTFQTLTSCNPADTGVVATTYTNQFGCDSVHTVTTTFLLSDSTFQTLTSCNPADTGVVATTYTNQFGCDSVHTVTTTFLLSDSTFQTLTSCNPADTGVVSTTYTNQFGCDSVHTVTTTFLLSDSTFQTLTSCNPADTGIVSTTYTNQFGCDSVHTVTTTFLLSDSTFQTLTSCNPADTGVVATTYTNQFGCDSVHTVTTTFLLSDSTFQTLTSCNPADTGIVSTTYTNQSGCDSVHTVTTTFLLSDSTFQILTSCNPADTGIVSTTYTNQFGCDSVHTVTTTFLLSDSTFQILTSCNPADTGVVATTYTNQFGCDSVHTVTTTFLLSDSTFQILTSCNPADTGIVSTTYTNQFGCDSVHTVTTTFLLSDSTFQTLTSCNPADTGIVSTTYTNQFGCDSVHTVTTTFLLSDSTFQTLTSCNPADTGVVSTTYTNQFGCDSVHTVTTTFLLSDSTFQTLTSCNPADTGVVSTTYTNQFGCDSVHTVTTTFLLSDSTFQTLTSCNPADTGVVSTTYTNQFGCDSVHTVTTTFLLSDSTFQILTSCNPADTGVVATTYTNQFGCDSVHTVTTTFLLSDSTFQTLTSCNPADTGIVSTTYTNQFGCDSVHTVTTTFLLSDSTFQTLTSCNPADTGVVSTTYTNQFGCDSVHTVTTTFLLSDSTFQTLTSCNPADTGVVSTTYTNQFGCDSVHTVTTTFLLSDSTFQILTSCNPADTGVVATTYTNQFGCDSVHTVTTTFLLSDSTFQTLTSCNPADTGIVSTTYTNQFGCDSVHTVTTTFLLSDSTFQILTSCNPADTGVVATTYTNQFGCDSVHTVTTTFLLSDSTFQTLTSCNPADTGVVSTTYTNQFGCDSVHTVTTTFLLSDSTFQTLTSCNPADTGVVATTYTNQFGCDSVHTVTTTFLLSDSTFQTLTSCNPADTGVVATTYTNQFGCDSVHTVTTTFLLSDSTFQTLTSCNPADTGVVATTYTNQFGCDSVHTVTTTFLLSDSTFQTLTSCNPADTGVVSTTYTNQFGCDSVHTVTTTFLLSDSTFQTLTSCNPADTGIVSTTYTNQFGCDSVHTVTTTFLLSDSTFQTLTSCNPADTGVVATTYTNQFGCDSVHTVTTTFLLSDSTFQTLTSCNPADTGIVSTTYTNQSGCDSVHTVTTTFLLSDSTFQILTSCNPADTGIVSTTYTNQFGCDSVHTVTTTFLLSDSTFQILTSCNPADTGVVATTYTNQFGCDSVHTVTTTFLLSDSTFQILTSCNPADTGIVSTTYTNQFGCDSVHTVTTTFLLSDSTFQTLTSCNPADTGIVSTTYTNQFGCDSVHTVTTTFLLSDSTFQTLTSCNPADTGVVSTTYTNQFGCDSVHTVTTTFLLSDSTFQTLTSCNPADTGVVSTTYTNQFGCDSVHTVTTTFLLSDSTFQTLTSCNPADTGIVSTTYTNQFGCDSVHTVTTTFLLSDSTFQTLTSCNPADTGIVSATYTNQFGCDSVHTVTTTFLLSDSTFQILTSCNPADTGVVATTYTNQFGCDSVHTVTTTFLLSDSTFQTLTSCNPADTGVVSTTYTNQFGCDSVHTVTTTFLLSDSTFQTLTSCNPADTGVVATTYTNQSGCDSVHTVTTTFLLSDSTFQTLTSCNPADTGVVATTYTNQSGCDSVHTVTTTFLLSDSTFQTLTSCNPADTGVVATTYTNQSGCDSVHTVTTTFLLSDSTFQTLTSCNPADTGVVATTYTNQFGCDSVHTVTTTFLLSDSTFQTLTSCNPADTGVVATTYTNQFGCDSVHTVTTTFLLSDSTFQTLTSCNPADTGVVATTYTNQSGCDSVHTVTTTFLLSDSTFQTLTSCNPADTGIVSTTYTNQFGCDSVHTVTTTFLLSDSTFQILTSCNPADTGIVSTTYTNQFGCDSVHTVTTTFLLSDSTFQTLTSCNPADTGVVSTTYTNQFGCDSVHTVTTTFLLSDSTFQTLTSCNPADTGVVSTTYTNQFGCDSVHTVTTTFLLSDSTFQTLTSCNPADTGIVSTTYTNQFGCDSVHTVTTTFLLSDSTFQTLTSCNPSDTGIVSTTYTNQSGCDSVHTVTTTFLLSDSTFQILTSCNPADTGVVSTTYTNQFGCDSVHTVTTTFLLSDSTFQTLTSCNPADTGIVSTTYTNQFGCDSVHTVTTTFLLSDSTFQTLTSCNPADTGVVATTYTNQFGCDSVHTVTTTFLLSDSTFQILTSCNPADTGVVATTYTNQFGCDSVHTVTTTLLSSQNTTVTDTICFGQNYTLPDGTSTSSAGQYITTLTAANGCDSIITTNLTVSNPAIAETHIDATCGNANGSIDITATGGIGAYTYQWSNGPTTEDISNANTGNYIVTVTDGTGCTTTLTINITNSTTPLLSETHINTLCGLQTGSIYLTVIGGTAPYSYLWSNTETTEDLAGLDVGTYTVTVTDANGCTGTLTIDIICTPPPPCLLTVSATGTNNSCFNSCDGSINITVNNATGAIIYNWSNGATTQNLNNLCIGTYSVTVSDANGCVDSATVTITEPTQLTVSVTPTDASCFNSATGSATINASGGTINYNYLWSNGATTPNISLLTANSYSLTVTDNNGCTATASATVNQPAQIQLSTAITDESCGNANGQIDLTVTNGVAAFSYNWSNGGTTANISSLTANSYTITVTDNNGCTATTTAIVQNTPPPIITAIANPTTICNGDNTTITANGASTYTWAPSATLNQSTGAVVIATPTNTTTYTVTGTAATGCTSDTTIVITVNPIPVINVNNATICIGDQTNLTANGATTYAWSPNTNLNQTTGQTVIANPATTITYTVTGTTAGCTSTATAVVTVNPLPLITTNIIDTSICSNSNATLTVGGANTYVWTPNNGLANTTSATQVASPTITTTYTITGTNANGCTNTATITVNINQLPIVTVTLPQGICPGQTAQLTANGADTYTWNPATALNQTTGQAVNSTPQNNITYTVSGTNTTTGCVNTATTNITINPLPILTINPNPGFICIGDNINLTASGATTYNWSPSSGLNTTIGATVNASPTTTTTYTITGTNQFGCIDSTTSIVTVGQYAIVDITIGPNEGCEPLTVYFINNTTGAASYVWNFGDNTSSGDTSPTHTYSTGTYHPSITITSTTGCVTTINPMDTIVVHPLPTADFSSNPDFGITTILENAHYEFTNQSSGADFYQWMFGDGTGDTTIDATHTYTAAGNYNVTLIATTQYGCADTLTRTPVVIIDEPSLWIPNAFTPNGDGVNDFFGIYGTSIKSYHMKIFDRWGEMIFQNDDYFPTWDGNYHGMPLNVGVYVYLVQVDYKDGTTMWRKGDVTLIR